MAKTGKLLMKETATTYLELYPETDATVVWTAAEGLTATNVEDALKELYDLIQSITGGGVVTGVKGDAETTYRMGDVSISPADIGLGNVDNTSDKDKPVSTATQTAIEEAVADALSEAKEYADVVDLATTKDDEKFIYTFTFTKADGTTKTTEIDLPLEEMILSCSYDKTTKTLTIELRTGEELEIDVDDIIGGLVNQSEYDEKIAELEDRIDTINTAEGNVEEAVKTAQAAAEAAQSAADAAEGHVTEVKETAEQAATDATQALTDAATAQTTAEAAQSAAETAQSTADAVKASLDDMDVASTGSAVKVNEAGIVVGVNNVFEYWSKGVTSSDTLAVGGFAFVED